MTALACVAAGIGVWACAAKTGDSGSSDEAIGAGVLFPYSSPDPDNAWAKGVDLSKLALGEETILKAGDQRLPETMDGKDPETGKPKTYAIRAGGEEAFFEYFVDVVRGTQLDNMKHHPDQGDHGKMRGFHAKGHTCVVGSVSLDPTQLQAQLTKVDQAPEDTSELGLFAKKANHPVFVRFRTASASA